MPAVICGTTTSMIQFKECYSALHCATAASCFCLFSRNFCIALLRKVLVQEQACSCLKTYVMYIAGESLDIAQPELQCLTYYGTVMLIVLS